MNKRFEVIKFINGKYVYYKIIDNKKNEFLQDPILNKKKADQICKRLNEEIK